MADERTWRERNRLKIEAGALAAIIGGSLALLPALSASAGLAAICFGIVTVGMVITMWVS